MGSAGEMSDSDCAFAMHTVRGNSGPLRTCMGKHCFLSSVFQFYKLTCSGYVISNPKLFLPLSLCRRQHGWSGPVFWNREESRRWLRVQRSSSQVGHSLRVETVGSCSMSSSHKNPNKQIFVPSLSNLTFLSCLTSIQPLHEADFRGAPLLPRQQCDSSRCKGEIRTLWHFQAWENTFLFSLF